jgi:hypothetical protein
MENKSYYAVIPATVRYDERLKLLSRMLYGEITALSNEKGYCWASNAYFANLYNSSIRTIKSCISELRECGYITLELKYKENSKEVDQRIIRISNNFNAESFTTYGKNFHHPSEEIFTTPGEKNCTDNITSINNTFNIGETKKKKSFTPPTLEEVKAYCEERKNNVDYKYFYDYYSSGNWRDKKGDPVKNWKQRIITWERNNQNKNYNSNPVKEEPKMGYKSLQDILKEEEEMLKRIKEKTGQC